MANFFRSILLRLQNKSVTASTSASTVSADSGYDGLGTVTVSPTPSETKTQTAGTSDIDVTPTSGKLLSKVTVSPTPTETASATPSTTAQTITPSSGKHLSSVSISAIQTQTKSATPSTTAQTITPDSGKYLTSVSVGAISTETKTQAAGTSNIDVTPTSGKYLTKVTITPQQHSGYYPSSSTNITSNGTKDLGTSHNYRYVNVNVPNPTLSGDAAVGNVLSGKTFYNSSYTKQTGTMTNNGAFEGDIDPSVSTTYELPPGYYSSIELDVLPHTEYSPSSSTYTHLAIGESKSIDLGQYHKYRYVRVEADAPTLSGDAAKANVLSGKTFYNTSTTKQTGTMTNNGDGSATLNCGESKTLTAGYYSGGTISANSLASQTGVDSGKTAVTAAKMFSGYQGWVNGNKVSGTYTEPTINNITPADSINPPSMTANSNYKPSKNGYAIESKPVVLQPSSTGEYFEEDTIYLTNSGGYAYFDKPSKTETTLWTNSSPTSSFAAKDVTGLSSGISNFDYIRITYRASTSDSTSQSTTFAVSELPSSAGRVTIGMMIGTGTRYRPIYKSSNTSIYIYGCYSSGSSTATNTYLIPTKIEGIKYTGIS